MKKGSTSSLRACLGVWGAGLLVSCTPGARQGSVSAVEVTKPASVASPSKSPKSRTVVIRQAQAESVAVPSKVITKKAKTPRKATKTNAPPAIGTHSEQSKARNSGKAVEARGNEAVVPVTIAKTPGPVAKEKKRKAAPGIARTVAKKKSKNEARQRIKAAKKASQPRPKPARAKPKKKKKAAAEEACGIGTCV